MTNAKKIGGKRFENGIQNVCFCNFVTVFADVNLPFINYNKVLQKKLFNYQTMKFLSSFEINIRFKKALKQI